MYKIIERCAKHGIEIVRVCTNYYEALAVMKSLVQKYAKKALYYRNLGFQAYLSQGSNTFMSLNTN